MAIYEGDRIPADGRVIQANQLIVDESLLTGESVPVVKCQAKGDDTQRNPGGDNQPFVYSGTLAVRGRALAIARGYRHADTRGPDRRFAVVNHCGEDTGRSVGRPDSAHFWHPFDCRVRLPDCILRFGPGRLAPGATVGDRAGHGDASGGIPGCRDNFSGHRRLAACSSESSGKKARRRRDSRRSNRHVRRQDGNNP
jgi:hypothetical protein